VRLAEEIRGCQVQVRVGAVQCHVGAYAPGIINDYGSGRYVKHANGVRSLEISVDVGCVLDTELRNKEDEQL